MIHKTTGIVLSYLKYGEHGIIVRIYTSTFGLQSYLVRSIRKTGNKHMQIGHFYPLVALNMLINHRPNRELQHLKEVNFLHPYTSLPFVAEKQPYVSLFSGLLQQLIQPHDDVPSKDDAFPFVLHSLQAFDKIEENYACFAIQFLAKLSHYVGIGVQLDVLRLCIEPLKEQSNLAEKIVEGAKCAYGDWHRAPSAPIALKALQCLLVYYERQWLRSANHMKSLSSQPALLRDLLL